MALELFNRYARTYRCRADRRWSGISNATTAYPYTKLEPVSNADSSGVSESIACADTDGRSHP